MRYQQAVGTRHLPFAKGAMLTGMYFRRESRVMGTSLKKSLIWTIRISEISTSAVKMQRNFEKNLNALNTVTVFKGVINLAAYTVGIATPLGGPGRQPSVKIPFSTSYKYQGGTLLIDILAKDPANKVVYVRHMVDRMELSTTAQGWLTHLGQACPLLNNRQFGDDSGLYPGGHLTFSLDRTGRITTIGINWLGFSTSQYGPMKLPFDLTPAGAPGCYLRTDIAMIWAAPMINEKTSIRWPIPNVPAAVGVVFNSQWAVNYTTGNKLGLTFSDVMQARLLVKGTAALDAVYQYAIQPGDITTVWRSVRVGMNKAHVMVFTVK
jgi:hypothetical protein